jgi:outer membrane immunogenic protein
MLKKSSMTGMVFGLFSSVSFGSGFYIGAGIGADTASFNKYGHISQLSNFNTLDKTHVSGVGVLGTLFGGYAWMKQAWYLAAEINGNISSLNFKSTNEEYVHQNFVSTRFKMNNSFGISALPGYLWSDDTLFYGRLGYNNGQLKVTTGDVSLGNISTRLNGFRYGLGLKQKLNDRFAVRVEYSQVSYGSASSTTFDALSSTLKENRISPTERLVELGIVYDLDHNEKMK